MTPAVLELLANAATAGDPTCWQLLRVDGAMRAEGSGELPDSMVVRELLEALQATRRQFEEHMAECRPYRYSIVPVEPGLLLHEPDAGAPAGPDLWYLSFADGALPEGTQFLGACIVAGADIMCAASEAHRQGCNPGGEVVGYPVLPDMAARIGPKWRNRLLSRADVDEFDREMGTGP